MLDREFAPDFETAWALRNFLRDDLPAEAMTDSENVKEPKRVPVNGTTEEAAEVEV